MRRNVNSPHPAGKAELPSSEADSFSAVRVAIDARALLQERTGIGTYTFAIARGLAARPDTSVGLFAPRPFPASVNGSGPGAFSLQTDHHPFGIVWLHSTLPQRIARWGADVLISALTIGPARGETPFVSTVHDLTPLTHPEWHAARTLIGFVPLWERTVERASRFLCVSQTTARDLVSRYPETANRVRVARNGVDTSFFSPADDPVARRRTRQRYSAGRPFVLYLGTLEPRKNVEALVVACERMWGRRRSRPDLVLAGGAGWKTGSLHRRIARSAYRDKIHVTGYAARDAARELYRSAEAFVYPSLAEGFGLPILEAMAAGCPVLTSNRSSMSEVAGDAALLADPDDPGDIAVQMRRLLVEPGLRDELRQRGVARAAEFSWRRAADLTAQVYDEAL